MVDVGRSADMGRMKLGVGVVLDADARFAGGTAAEELAIDG